MIWSQLRPPTRAKNTRRGANVPKVQGSMDLSTVPSLNYPQALERREVRGPGRGASLSFERSRRSTETERACKLPTSPRLSSHSMARDQWLTANSSALCPLFQEGFQDSPGAPTSSKQLPLWAESTGAKASLPSKDILEATHLFLHLQHSQR